MEAKMNNNADRARKEIDEELARAKQAELDRIAKEKAEKEEKERQIRMKEKRNE